MVLSLSVVAATHFARVSRQPARSTQMLSTLLKSRAASYGVVGASSLLVLASDSGSYDVKEMWVGYWVTSRITSYK